MNAEPNILIEDAGEAAPLVITFGFAQWNEPAAFDFVGRLRKIEFMLGRPFHRIHLRDPSMSWYLHGIDGLGASLRDTLAEINRRIQGLKPTRVTTLGQSMGGYGAIRYGVALGVDRVLAFGALSSMDPSAARARSDTRWLSVMERLEAEGIAAADTDLVELASRSAKTPEMLLHYGAQPDEVGQGSANPDVVHAERFAQLTCARVQLHGDAGHLVVQHLKAQREIDAVLLHDLFEVDPARLHRRTRPLLNDDWLRWIAENRLRRSDVPSLVAAMDERGIDPITARSAVAEVERDPIFFAAQKLLRE